MEQTQNTPPIVQPDSGPQHPVSAARVSDLLNPSLIEPDPPQSPHPTRRQRHDGWTPERIRIFLETLADCGVVSDACRAAGMSLTSAYRLRNSAAGRPFMLAWRAAQVRACRQLGDALMSRAVNGCVDRIYRDGKLAYERHRYDNRLTLNVYERLEKTLTRDSVIGAVGAIAEEFEQFVDIVSEGGERAADFVHDRVVGVGHCRDVHQLVRAANYQRYRVGLPKEIDVSDLVGAEAASLTEEQLERARRAGLAWERYQVREDDSAETGDPA